MVLGLALDERDGFVGDQRGAVVDADGGDALAVRAGVGHDVAQRHAGVVPPERSRVVIVCVGLVEVAEEIIKALVVRRGRAVLVAEAPFTDERGVIAGLFEQAGDGAVLGFQPDLGIAADGGVAGVLAGHEHAARRRADGGAGVELREAQALRRQPVDVRCGDLLLPVAPEVAVAEIVGEDEDDVGPRIRGGQRAHHEQGQQAETG